MQAANSAAGAGHTPLAERVLIIYHADVPESLDVAQHYRQARGIPEANLCGIAFPSELSVREDHYQMQVKGPLRDCLKRVGDRNILYLVFSYRTPYKVMLPGQRFDSSVDSLAADIWDEVHAVPAPTQPGPVHPYYADHHSQQNRMVAFQDFAAFRAQASTPRIYAVWRLDAASATLAKGLVDKAMQAERKGPLRGKGCFDRNTASLANTDDRSYGSGEWAIQRAADLTRSIGFPLELDTHHQEFGEAPAPARCDDAALYTGWYSLNNYNDAFTWADGAIGLHLDSMSAWNLREGTSWVVNAVNRGITITSGAVSEPYLPNLAQPDGVIHALIAGANVGDAFLRSTPLLKWRIVNVGDPLYRPFPTGAPVDPVKEAPTMILRSPAVLGGVPAVVMLATNAPAAKEQKWKITVSPADLGAAPSEVRLAAGEQKQEFQIRTAGVTERTTLRVLAEADGAQIGGSIFVLPVMGKPNPETQKVTGGQPVSFTITLGATVQSGTAPFKVKSSCPSYLQAPEVVQVSAGNAVLRVDLTSKPVQKETTCTITVEKYGAEQKATVVLLPGGA